MRVLLTGSRGFLGRNIISFFKNRYGEEIHFDSLNKNVDLRFDIPQLNKYYPVVIHSAGKAHVSADSLYQKNDFFLVNVNGTINLLKGLELSFLPKSFVYISSVSVYGLNNGMQINEDQLLLAQDAYGKSKIEAEIIVKEWCVKNNVKCTILRLPLVLGSNAPGNLGKMIHGIKKGYYFNISGGIAQKSMVLSSDIAKFILKAAEVGGTYNLTDGYNPNFKELSHLIAFQLNKKFVPNIPLFLAKLLAFVGDKIGPIFPINSNNLNKITSTLTFDDSKARKAFGWKPTAVLKGFNINE